MLGRKWTFPSLNYDYITWDQRAKQEELKRHVTILSPVLSLSAGGISQFLLQAAGKLQTLNLDLSLKLIGLFWKKKSCTSADSGDAAGHVTTIFSPLILSSLLQANCC